MVVGRHIDFGDGSRLQIFRHGNDEVRAIKDEPGFELEVNPPLPAGHLYQRHRLEHDPPVDSGIFYLANQWVLGGTGRWVPGEIPYTDASVSSFAKDMSVDHFDRTYQTNITSKRLNR